MSAGKGKNHVTSLTALFTAVADVFDDDTPIERLARQALLSHVPSDVIVPNPTPLPEAFITEIAHPDAHPACHIAAQTPLCWAPPETSSSSLYKAHSLSKIHVELIGPDGLLHSNEVRLGLYGMLPGSEYGLRTHPAEEVFVMMAGQAYWMRGTAPYALHRSGERSVHPSQMPHATKTGDHAFLAAFAWRGDLSTENYVYAGLPGDE